MNNLGYAVIGSIVGAGIGSGITYLLVKDKFQKLYEEDTEYTREYYKNKCVSCKGMNEEENNENEEWKEENQEYDDQNESLITIDDDNVDYNEIIEKLNYNQYSTRPDNENDEDISLSEEEKESFHTILNGVCIISGDEYNEENGYVKENLIYLEGSDEMITSMGVVVDYSISDKLIDLIQKEGFDDGMVYISDTINRIDYEISQDNRTIDEFLDEEEL